MRIKMKMLGILLTFMIGCISSFGYVTVTWYDLDYHIYNASGTDHATDADWLFQLVIDVDGDTSVAGMIGSGQWQIGSGAGNNADDDVTLSSWNNTWTADPNYGYVTGPNEGDSQLEEPTYASKKFYYRFFNSSTEAGATEAGFVYNTAGNWTTASSGSSYPQESADLTRVGGEESSSLSGTTVTGANDGWATTVAVPEPTTFALFGVGLLTLVVRRFRK